MKAESKLESTQYSNLVAFGAGAAGGLAMAALIGTGLKLGITSMNMPMFLGSAVTHEKSPRSQKLGLGLHLLASGAFGLLYGFGFRHLNRSGPKLGAAFSALHWLVSGVGLGFMSKAHPLMPQEIPPPGYFAMNRNIPSRVGFLVGHLVYGATLGELYRLAMDRSRKQEKKFLPADLSRSAEPPHERVRRTDYRSVYESRRG